LNITNTCTIINRLKEKDGPMLQGIAMEKGLQNIAKVRDDEEVMRADREGKSIFQLPVNSVALADAYGIFKRTLGENR
jgi:CO dehydrogenase nickel-insertion accessory protein CooC1